ncbi:MAG: hypothetical protein HY553_22635 [Elusimicrobia bacterium]|nr:hypothetical protein [Elusimicrobiota bacterium]
MLALALLVAQAASACDRVVWLRLTPEFRASSGSVSVEVRFRGDPSGVTRLNSPDRARHGGRLEDLRVDRPARFGRDGELRVIRHKPSADLRLTYRLLEQPGHDDSHDVAGIIRKELVHLIGSHAFVLPETDGESVYDLAWNAPADWSSADSFGASGLGRRVCTGLDTFRHAVFAAGRLRLTERAVRGKPVWLATSGAWTFSDAELADVMAKIFEAERGFWNDDDFPYYLVSLVPRVGEGHHGSAFTNSFALWAGSTIELKDGLTETLAHELFHAWNGGKIRKDELESRMYWFSEGFTDYYTRLLLLRAGLLSLEEYVSAVNEKLREYFSSPSREEPNERIAKDFWNDYDVQRLPYRRGDVLALKWNAEIKRRSGGARSLDDAMRELFRAAVGRGVQASSKTITELFAPLAPSVELDLERVVERGGLVDVPADALGPCASLSHDAPVAFELGFDWKRSEPDKIVRGVVEGSAAWRAGLREGQELGSIDIVHGNATREVGLTVFEGEAKRPIRYLPARPLGGPPTPRFALDADRVAQDRAACLAWLQEAR